MILRDFYFKSAKAAVLKSSQEKIAKQTVSNLNSAFCILIEKKSSVIRLFRNIFIGKN